MNRNREYRTIKMRLTPEYFRLKKGHDLLMRAHGHIEPNFLSPSAASVFLWKHAFVSGGFWKNHDYNCPRWQILLFNRGGQILNEIRYRAKLAFDALTGRNLSDYFND